MNILQVLEDLVPVTLVNINQVLDLNCHYMSELTYVLSEICLIHLPFFLPWFEQSLNQFLINDYSTKTVRPRLRITSDL